MKRTLFRAAVSAGAFTVLLAAPVFSQTTFHKYVALGDSLTAAVEGSCLVQRHQNRSYPKLVAEQLGITDFQQPLLSERALSNPLTGGRAWARSSRGARSRSARFPSRACR